MLVVQVVVRLVRQVPLVVLPCQARVMRAALVVLTVALRVAVEARVLSENLGLAFPTMMVVTAALVVRV